MKIRHYSIRRECWNEHTYNGYSDNPYWYISINGKLIGLSDDGTFWSIDNKPIGDVLHSLKIIVAECKLNIPI